MYSRAGLKLLPGVVRERAPVTGFVSNAIDETQGNGARLAEWRKKKLTKDQCLSRSLQIIKVNALTRL